MAGQIIEKGKRKYLVRVFRGRNVHGKREYVSRLVHGGKRDAQDALTDLLKEKSTGGLTVKAKETVGEYLDAWLETTAKPSVRSRTLADYTRVIDAYIRPHLGNVRLSRLSALEVRGMLAKLGERGLGPRTIRMAHEVIRNALEQAVSDRLLRDNPARARLVAKALPAKVQKEPATIPADAVGGFLEVARDDRLGAFWVLQLLGGLRPSEGLALRWSDVNDDTISVTRVLVDRAGPVHFAPPKSKTSRRAVVVPDVVVQALREHRKQQLAGRLVAGPAWEDGGLIFCDETGKPLRQDHVRWHFKKVSEAAELPSSLTLYSLRHSCAMLLLEKGVPLKIVSERLGHSTIALTADVYSHVTRSMQQQAADVLGELARG